MLDQLHPGPCTIETVSDYVHASTCELQSAQDRSRFRARRGLNCAPQRCARVQRVAFGEDDGPACPPQAQH
eukprot:9115966-Lingulodinium_polyedra.AAC.1